VPIKQQTAQVLAEVAVELGAQAVREVLILEELVVRVKFQVSMVGLHILRQGAVELRPNRDTLLVQEQVEPEVVVEAAI
jgi:hypothetical protein